MGGTYSIRNETAYKWYYSNPTTSEPYLPLRSDALETKAVTKTICLKYENDDGYVLRCDYGGFEYRIIEKRNSRQFELLCGTEGHRHVCPHFDLERRERQQREQQQQERERREKREREEREKREREEREKREREEREKREREQREKIAREQREKIEREQWEKIEREQRELIAREQRVKIAIEQREKKEREQREKIEREQRELIAREQRVKIAIEQREKKEREQREKIEREQRELIAREQRVKIAIEQREKKEREQREKIEREQRELIAREQRVKIAREQREKIEREQREKIEREQRERQEQEKREREQREKVEREQRERQEQEKREREQRERREREVQEKIVREQNERREREQERLRQEREQREKIEREQREKNTRELWEKIARQQRELIAREQRVKIAREQREKIEREQREKIEREQREKIEREQREKIEREQREKIEREQREKNTRELWEKIARQQRELIAREQREKVAREQREKIEREQREKIEREQREKIAREQREKIEREQWEKNTRELWEKIARQQRELIAREQTEKVAREQREKIEREQREKIEREQREKIEREQREKIEREQREKIEREQREKIEREEREKIEREQREKIEREQWEKSTREQREKIEREQREKSTREQREKIAREQWEKSTREQREKIAREWREKIAREWREKIAREQRERQQQEKREREQREKVEREQRERQEQEKREREERDKVEREERERQEQEKREREEREKVEREQREKREREKREQWRREQEHRAQQRREQELREQQRQEHESRQDFRGKTKHQSLQLQFQSDNAGEEWNELLKVEGEFHQLLLDFNITEEEQMQVSTLEDRMAALFMAFIDHFFEGDHLSFSSLVTIEQKIGFQDMVLSEKLTVLRAMLQQTPYPSYNDLAPHLKGREGSFVLSLLEELQEDNPDMAVRILHRFTESMPCLTPESRETLGYILYNHIWIPFEVMQFLQRVETSSAHHSKIPAILERTLWNGLTSSSVLSALEEADPINYLMKEVESEEDKDLDTLISEMRDDDYPESALSIIYAVLYEVQQKLSRITSRETFSLAKTKGSLKLTNFDNPDISLLQELLISMSLAVRDFTTPKTRRWPFSSSRTEAQNEAQGYFPRLTQLASLLALLLPQSKGGKGCLLQVATGEGKTCILAMFAAIQAMRGMKPDIITSSPVLAERDQQKWESFYDMFGLASSVACLPSTDNYEELVRKAYVKDIVYGTMETFAADTLRQEFEGQTTRGTRRFEMAIVDEVDFMTLDNGMQVTFLSHDTSILRHMEQVLAGIWAVLSACRPIAIQETGEMQWTTRPQVLHKTVESALSISESVALEILQLAVELDFCSQAEMNEFIQADGEVAVQNDNQDRKWKALEKIMARIGPDQQYELLKKFNGTMEEDVPMEYFSVKGNKAERYGDTAARKECIRLLLLENGYACQIMPEDELIMGTVENLMSKLKFSNQCNSRNIQKLTDCLVVPSFLKEYTENQLHVFAESALRAIVMVEGREYMIEKAQEADRKEGSEKESHQFDAIIPVDFISSGILQKNSKWGEGLQQFLEMKHQLAISSLSTVTNYMSNIHYLRNYVSGRGIFGVTGTLGGDAEKDFLSQRYQTNGSIIPTHRHKKLVEVPAVSVQGGEMLWSQKICDLTLKAANRGQVVLIVCEDVNTADSLHAEMKTQTNQSISLYTISGRHEIEEKTFGGGDVIIATNLAGRGTDVQVKPDVNTHGGLFVILTHFPSSERVEQQAFGRTARKGNQGMVQMVLNQEKLEPIYQGQTIHTMRQRRSQRERENIEHMEADGLHVIDIKDKLFSVFCEDLDNFRKQYTEKEKKGCDDIKNIPDCFKSYCRKFDFHPAINALKEAWAFWLLHNENHICEAKTVSDIQGLEDALKEELKQRRESLLGGQSPNFHDHIKQAENRTDFHRWTKGASFGADKYWERAAKCDQMYSAVALYNQAYVTINLREPGYMLKAEELLKKANDLVDVFLTETTNTMSFCHLSVTRDFKPHNKRTNFSMQMETRMNIFKSWKGYIKQALDKLEEISNNKDDAVTEVSTVYRLLDDKEFIASNELRTMDKYGLGIVFEVKQKPKFSWNALVCFLIGTLQVVAGILVCALSAGAAFNFGFGIINEGVSDMIEGVKGMATGAFSWADWAISKAISIGVSLLCGAFKLVQKCGLSAKRIGQAIQKGTKNMVTSAKSATTMTLRQTTKEAFKYSAQQMAKQGILAGLNYGIDKALEASFKSIFRKAFYDKVIPIIKGSKPLHSAVSQYIWQEYPEEWIETGTYFKLDPKCEEDISKSIELMTTAVTPQLLTGLSNAEQVISILSKVANTAVGKLGESTLSNISKILDSSEYVIKVYEILRDIPTTKIINDFVSLLLQRLEEQSQKSQITINNINKQMLEDMKRLQDKIMEEIAKTVSEKFIETFVQRVTSIASKGITTKVNEVVGEVVGNVLSMPKTIAFFENQKRNHRLRVASKAPTESLTQTELMELQRYAADQSSTERPANGADIHILAMSPLLEGKGIRVIVTDENGKPHYEEHYPGSKKSAGDITLRLVKTKDKSQQKSGRLSSLKRKIRGELQPYSGHFEVMNNNTISQVHSEGQNCFYHAVVQAISGGQRDVNDLRRDAIKLRHDVAQEVKHNPAKYYNVLDLQKQYIGTGRYTIDGGANKEDRRRDLEKYSVYLNKSDLPEEQISEYKSKNLGFVSEHTNVIAARTIRDRNQEADHIPPIGSISYAKTKQQEENNNQLYKILTGEHGKTRGAGKFSMEVRAEHHKAALTSGASREARACRQKLADVACTGDMEKTLKMSFIAAHPETSSSLRNSNGSAKSNTMSDAGYYKIGFHQLVDKYHEKGCIDNNLRNNLHGWVSSEHYTRTDTPEYIDLQNSVAQGIKSKRRRK